jgi:hypothetical protein
LIQFPKGISIAVPLEQAASLLVGDPLIISMLWRQSNVYVANINGKAMLGDDINVLAP